MSCSSLMADKKIIQKKKPVIIYVVPPKVIHAEASEFMALVQRLTGKSPSSSSMQPPELNLGKSSKDLVGKLVSRQQFSVRVKARPAASRQPSCLETVCSPSSYLSHEDFSSQSCSSGGHEVQPVFFQSSWPVLDGDHEP